MPREYVDAWMITSAIKITPANNMVLRRQSLSPPQLYKKVRKRPPQDLTFAGLHVYQKVAVVPTYNLGIIGKLAFCDLVVVVSIPAGMAERETQQCREAILDNVTVSRMKIYAEQIPTHHNHPFCNKKRIVGEQLNQKSGMLTEHDS